MKLSIVTGTLYSVRFVRGSRFGVSRSIFPKNLFGVSSFLFFYSVLLSQMVHKAFCIDLTHFPILGSGDVVVIEVLNY
jgi:hypothetical protein